MKKMMILCGLALLAGCGGGGTLTAQEQQLALARSSWKAKGLRSYKLTVRKNCFCPEEYTRAVTITVQNGVATDSPEHLKSYDTVEKLLDTIGTGLSSKADQVDMDFASDGWPRSFYIDQSRTMADVAFLD